MNRVYIIFKDGKVVAVRSTETLAKVFVRTQVITARTLGGGDKYKIEEWEVTR